MAKAKRVPPFSDNTSRNFGFSDDAPLPIEKLLCSLDYAALSQSFVKKGELSLLHCDISGLRFFDMAIELDPRNPNLFLRRGLALFEYGSAKGREAQLISAGKSFKSALALNPNFFEAWHAWGNTLYLLGLRKNNPTYFEKAKKKYDRALMLLGDQPQDVLADLYWDLGDLWSKFADLSGEATDLNLAIKFYEKATLHQDGLPSEFWVNFGDAYRAFGEKTSDLRLHIKAVNCYKNGISISIESHIAWLRLANVLKEIYMYTHDEDHYSQANECYSAAAQLCPSDGDLWVNWAELLLESGKHFRDTTKLRACIEKCHRSQACRPNNVDLVSIWSEALAHLGLFSETLECLYDAQNKVEALCEEGSKCPSLYYSYGMCLFILGIYFKDVDYFYQSVEKFQEGLSLNRSVHRLWFGIAIAYVAAAEIDQDKKHFERACRFFQRALHFKVNSIYHYHFGYCYLKYSELVGDRQLIERAVYHFEKAIGMQKTASYQRPEWLFHYAISLDYLGEYSENEDFYLKALDILNHVLMLSPDFPLIHSQMAVTFSHCAELLNEPDIYQKAFHHYRIAYQRDKENDQILLEWAVSLVNFSEHLSDDVQRTQCYKEAEYKAIQAAKLGNSHAYFSLACIYSLTGEYGRSLYFLKKSHTFESLPPREEILEDHWLEGVRTTRAFADFIEKIKSTIQE